MNRYKNTRTGAVVTTMGVVTGDGWELVPQEIPPQEVTSQEEGEPGAAAAKPKTTTSKPKTAAAGKRK